MTSTHMVLRKGAFDAYDTIFCVGPHHVAESREAEQIYGLKPRSLAEIGYVKLDALLD
jgi:YidC/Oxa1 family membrane protein insertase